MTSTKAEPVCKPLPEWLGHNGPMSFGKRAASAYGLARSLLMYYAIPGRARAWRDFYAGFLNQDALAFDIGAHVGNRTRALASTGARVIAVEASAPLADLLEWFYGQHKRVTILNQAVAAEEGAVRLFSSRRFPTVNTVNPAWREQVGQSAGFSAVRWEDEELVEAITLDRLIGQFGLPDFCKLDIEGNELEALRGLSRPIRGLSFEYIPAVKEIGLEVIARLQELGDYRFNYFADEVPRYALDEWLEGQDMAAILKSLDREARAGEIIARLVE